MVGDIIRELVGLVLGVKGIDIFELKKEVGLFVENNKVGLFLEPLVLLRLTHIFVVTILFKNNKGLRNS